MQVFIVEGNIYDDVGLGFLFHGGDVKTVYGKYCLLLPAYCFLFPVSCSVCEGRQDEGNICVVSWFSRIE
jgi:hypothetical protein